MPSATVSYRGRLAPSPTGLLHLGHAATFLTAWRRCREAGGTLLLRNEDLDTSRVRPEFAAAMLRDLRWLGIDWNEGPEAEGPNAPYTQSDRRGFHLDGFNQLLRGGRLYPCHCSRRDIRQALGAPHDGEEEPPYPGTCRPPQPGAPAVDLPRAGVSWRFRVPDGETIAFTDGAAGPQQFIAGVDFGDFVVWRKDDMPAYQLAVVLDDHAMGVTEVVRGADLLLSTARQLLLYRALSLPAPDFYHCPLLRDESGKRLAKRHDALSLHALREAGETPATVRRLIEHARRQTGPARDA